MHIFTLHRAFMQHFSQSIWMPSSDVGGRPLCIVGNGLGIICHKHHPHLLVYRSHYRYHHLLFYSFTEVRMSIQGHVNISISWFQVLEWLWTSSHHSLCWIDISVRSGRWLTVWLQLGVQWLCAVCLLWGKSFSMNMAGEGASSSWEGSFWTAVPAGL